MAAPLQRWCLGLLEAGSRELEASEADDLRRRRHAERIAGLTALGAIPVAALSILALTAVARRSGVSSEAIAWGVGVPTLVFVLLILPALMLAAVDRFRTAHRIGRDLVVGRVDRFRGTIRAGKQLDRPRRLQLAALGLLADAEMVHEVEVLPQAGSVHTVDGDPARRPIRPRVVRLASPPDYAMRVAVPREFDAKGGGGMERRSLSLAELAEIRAHIGRLRRIPWGAWLLGGWLSAGAAVAASRGWAEWTTVEQVGLAIWLVAILLVVRGRVAEMRMAGRLHRDVDLGWAVTPRREEAKERELLPNSGVAWTEGGRPAPWRWLFR